MLISHLKTNLHFYKEWNVYEINNYVGTYKICLVFVDLQPIFCNLVGWIKKKKNNKMLNIQHTHCHFKVQAGINSPLHVNL